MIITKVIIHLNWCLPSTHSMTGLIKDSEDLGMKKMKLWLKYMSVTLGTSSSFGGKDDELIYELTQFSYLWTIKLSSV